MKHELSATGRGVNVLGQALKANPSLLKISDSVNQVSEGAS